MDERNAALMGLAEGLKGFASSYADAEDRKYRRLEMEARMKAQQTEQERQKTMTELALRNANMKLGPGGQLEPDRDAQRREDVLRLAPSGLRPAYDDQGMLAGTSYDPEFLRMRSRSERLQADPYGVKGIQAQNARMELEKRQRESEMARANSEFDLLPEDKKIQVKSLTSSLADRKSISNDIKAGLSQLKDPSKSDDEKLLIGRELLKTLNSTQGKDAIGAEEAKRLGSLLEFKIIPRIGEPGNMFGRDLPMFTTQVENNANRLGESINRTQSQIDELLGRPVESNVAGLVPKGLLEKKGLLEGAARGLMPEASASGNKIKVSNGKETFFIDPRDLKEAEKDGFKRVGQ